MAIATTYYSASGPSHEDCAFLAQRFDAESGYKPYEGECWICTAKRGADGKIYSMTHIGSTGWLTRLWRSPLGRVYVSSAGGTMHMSSDPRDMSVPFETPVLDAALFGVWGIDDEFVLAWGTRKQRGVMYRWDGKAWSEVPAPDFGVRAVHGIAPDAVYAAGLNGSVARWDGSSWQKIATPTTEILASIFVVSEDEIYAVGNQGTILEGSAAGWGKIGEGPGLPGPLACVAKFGGDLWVGAGQLGLFKRQGTTGRFDCVKPNLHAVDFDARERLLISCDDMIASTDGQAFKATGKDWLAKMRSSKDLGDIS